MRNPVFAYSSPMIFPMTGFIKRRAFSLAFLAALSACLPFNQPAPVTPPLKIPLSKTAAHPVSITTPIPTLLISSPSETPHPTPLNTPSPTVSCLSLPGQLVDGVLDTTLLAKPMTYHVYLPPCYTEQQDRHYPVLYLLH